MPIGSYDIVDAADQACFHYAGSHIRSTSVGGHYQNIGYSGAMSLAVY